jgi:hypothetical protein
MCCVIDSLIMQVLTTPRSPTPSMTPLSAIGNRPKRGHTTAWSARSLVCGPALALALGCMPTLARATATPPDPSCERSTLSAGPLRIDAWSCALKTGRWHLRAEPGLPGFALWIDDTRQETVVHALPRAAGAPLSSVVAALARAGLVPPDDCVIVRTRRHAALRGARAYEIRPTGARLAALLRTPQDEVPEPPCGEYGWSTHGVRGFVVDPRRPQWVVYLNQGQDGMLFDPATLVVGD